MASTMYYGHGDFSKIYEKGTSALSRTTDTILQCVEGILSNSSDVNSNSAFTIADYGTADGSVSVPVLNKIINLLQSKKGKDTEIHIILEDQVANDFNYLFKVIYGSNNGNQKNSLNTNDNVFVSVIGNSMFNQCLPTESAHLIISSLTIHFLSEIPCQISDGICLGTATKEEFAQFQKVADRDWKEFIMKRGKELKRGGHLVVLVLGKDSEGRSSMCIPGGHETLATIAKQLITENVFTKEEYIKMTFGAYQARTEEEMSKIFRDDKDIKNLGLELKSLEFKSTDNAPGLTEDEKKDECARRDYAKRIVQLNTACYYNTIFSGLSGDRSEEERHNIVKLYFKRVEDFSFNSETFPPLYSIYAEVVVSKK